MNDLQQMLRALGLHHTAQGLDDLVATATKREEAGISALSEAQCAATQRKKASSQPRDHVTNANEI